ncbi:MAG: hypothetical protein ACLRHB_00660 [Parasutterella excrementihominis]
MTLNEKDRKEIEELKSKLSIINVKECSIEANNLLGEIRKKLKEYDIFLAKIDLEEDLFRSCIKTYLEDFYFPYLDDEIVKDMKKRKASHMYEFLKEKKSCLVKLADDDLALPLLKAKNYIETNYGTY